MIGNCRLYCYGCFFLILLSLRCKCDCDLSGLCHAIVKRDWIEKTICSQQLDCLSPRRINCAEDDIRVRFNCMATDCMEIQALAESRGACDRWFPRTVGTAIERFSQGFDQTPLQPIPP